MEMMRNKRKLRSYFQFILFGLHYAKKRATPVTSHEGPHFLDNRLTYGGEVVSITHQPPFTHRKIPGTHFC
jgi:hypothetical protein